MTARSLLLTLTLTLLCPAAVAQRATADSQQPSASQPAAYPHVEGTMLAGQIDALLSDPAVARAHWGIAVTTLDGVPIYGLDEGKLFRPASTAKLFTTAAAMALLGENARFTTRVYGDLDSKTGIVRGDLTLYGGGDPSFGTHDLPYTRNPASTEDAAKPENKASLANLAEKLTAAGVTEIDGDVLGNNTLFESATVPEGWAEEDLLWGYGARPSALSIGDNEVRVTVRPKATGPAAGEPSNWIGSYMSVDQLYPYLQVKDEVLTLPSDAEHQDGIDAQSVPGSPQTIRLFGRLSPSAPPHVEQIALNNSASYAAGALRALLLQKGIRIGGEAKVVDVTQASSSPFLSGLHESSCDGSLWGQLIHCAYSCLETPHSTHLIAEYTSPPLTEEVVFTLKTSANLHAEVLLHQIGLKVSCPGVTTLEGARVIRDWLLHIGLADHDFLFYDGSGLSAKDLVTPRAEAQLLAYAATQPWFAQWKAALPVGGVDGTLASRFTVPPLQGHVFAKTGTLGESRALAGYVQCASGREVIFSILVDNHDPSTRADRATMDKIVADIASSN